MTNDFPLVFTWWAAVWAIGIIFSPVTWFVLKRFSDSGWALSKIVGLALLAFTFFVFSSLKILPISQVSILLVILAFFVLNLLIYRKNRKAIHSNISSKKLPILRSEERRVGKECR